MNKIEYCELKFASKIVMDIIMLTYEHRLKVGKLMLLLRCLWHAFLEFLLLIL